MTTAQSDYLRPREAAARFNIPRTTLVDWAKDGLIGKFKHGRTVRYLAADIVAVIAAGTTARRIVPLAAASEYVDDSWRDSPLWAGTVAGRAAPPSPLTRGGGGRP